MQHAENPSEAPDFELNDFRGHSFRLSSFRDISNVLLVFNRGLT